MDSDRWRQIEDLFHTLMERPPEMRAAFLNDACACDAELRQEIESLLSQADHAENFLESSRVQPATLPAGASPLGKQFGAYRIVSQLGAGGMGKSIALHHNKLGRDVAIKTLPLEFAGDADRLARFRREARVLASLNHPNIAAIYGLEELHGTNYLVLEIVEGETLKDRIRQRGRLPAGEALEICRQVAEALEAAHEKGIIHRDLKPANVMVTPAGRVKVLDFGMAKAVERYEARPEASQLATVTGLETVAGQMLGTPPYMSPEQACGNNVDGRTDVWAFGCLLYELLTGTRAFRGEVLADTIHAVLEREPDWQALPAETPGKVLGTCCTSAFKKPLNAACSP